MRIFISMIVVLLFGNVFWSCPAIERTKALINREPSPEFYWDSVTETKETTPEFSTDGIQVAAIANTYIDADQKHLCSISDHLSLRLESKLVNTHQYRIVERPDLKTILLELRRANTDAFEKNGVKKIGKFLNADALVMWRLLSSANDSELDLINLRFLKTSTAEILHAETYDKDTKIDICQKRKVPFDIDCITTDFVRRIVPSKTTKSYKIQLKRDPVTGDVVPAGYIGVTPATNKQGSESGVLVLNVKENSPAAIAGVLPGDLIKSIDNESIYSDWKYRAVIGNKPVGRIVRLKIIRGREKRYLNVEVGKNIMKVKYSL